MLLIIWTVEAISIAGRCADFFYCAAVYISNYPSWFSGAQGFFQLFLFPQYDFSGRVGRAMGIFLQSGVWPFEYGAGSDRFGRMVYPLVGLSHERYGMHYRCVLYLFCGVLFDSIAVRL